MSSRRSIYDEFRDAYGQDPIASRYGVSDYSVGMELQRRKELLGIRTDEAQALGLEVRNTREMADLAYQTRERVDTEAQATDVLERLQYVQSPQEVISLLSEKRKSLNDPAVKSLVDNRLKEFETLRQYQEKAASLGGYFGDYESSVNQGAAPEDAFAAATVQRNQDLTRSRLEGLGIKAPEDPKELERLAVRAEAMEVDPAAKQMLTMEYRAADAVLNDPMTTDEEKADAKEQIERVRRQMSGPRQLAEETPDEKRAYIQRALGR